MQISFGTPSEPEDLVSFLLACHERIRSFVQLAGEVGRREQVADAEVIEACNRCDRYFREALPLHVEDEELDVLPRLKGLRPEVDSALREMHDQHGEHEPLLKAFFEVTRDVRNRPRDPAARERMKTAAAALSVEFEKHLDTEERVIFPALRSLLPPEVRKQVLESFRDRRRRNI